MTCYNIKGSQLNQKLKSGIDPLQAETEIVQMYKTLDSGFSENTAAPRTDVTFRDVYNFKNSDLYTDELKQELKPLADLITEEEALKDFMENGRVRNISEILQNQMSEEFEDIVNEFGPENILSDYNKALALRFANQLSDKLGVEHNVITEFEFQQMFPGRNAKNNPAFFLNGQVYFVEGYINSETVFHEFSHPVVKALRMDNQTIFDQLVSKAYTQENRAVIDRLVNEGQLDEASDEFKQELLVRLMENEFKSPSKSSFFSDLLFAIRQFLRKFLGRNIDISKLDQSTSLKDLVKMLEKGGEFVFTESFISQDDIAEFRTIGDDFIKGIEAQKATLNQEYLNKFYALVNDQVGYLKSDNPVYAFAATNLVDTTGTAQLDRLRKTLNNLAVLITSRNNKSLETFDLSVESEAEVYYGKIQSYANMFAEIDVVVDIFGKKTESLEEFSDKKSDDFFDSLLGMLNILNGWNDHYESLISKTEIRIMGAEGMIQNPYYATLVEQKNKMNSLLDRLNNLQKNSTVDLLYQHYQELNTPIVKQLKEELDYFESQNLTDAYNHAYESLYGISVVERAELRSLQLKEELTFEEKMRLDELVAFTENGYDLSREVFERIFSGQSTDASRLSRMFESYSSNQDAVVSSFYKILQQSLNQISGRVEGKMNGFLKGLQPLLKAAGFDNKIFGEGNVGRALGQRSKGYRYKEDGTLEEFDEIQMMSNYKDWQYDLEVLSNTVRKAKANWIYTGNDSDYLEYVKADQALKQFQRNYMNREFADIVYEADKIFESPIGRLALLEKNKVFDKINLVNNYLAGDPSNQGFKKALVEAWEEYRYLFSEYDYNGQIKTGDGLAIAKLLQEYKERSKDYYEWNEVPLQFETAFESFMASIEADEATTDPVKIQKIKDWLNFNTTTKISDSYFEKRKELLDRQKEILSVLNENNSGLGITDLYDELYAIISTSRDEFNVVDGRLMSPEKQKRIVEIHNEINKLYNFIINPKGFSQNEVKEFQRILLKRNRGIRLSPNERNFLDNYEATNLSLSESYLTGIGFAQIEELNAIKEELLEMTESVSTETYVNEFHRMLSNSTVADEYFRITSIYSGFNISDADLISPELIDDLIHNRAELIETWMAEDSNFKDWFLRNHYPDDHILVYNSEGNVRDIKKGYRKTASWKTSRPSSTSYYDTKSVGLMALLPAEFKQGTSLVINGMPVVPNNQYQVRTVKSEFLREKIERDYVDESGNLILANVDNRGNWLPKDYTGESSGAVDAKYIDANYKQMFASNRNLFNLLDYLKNFQLDSEKNLSASSRNYLKFPSFRMGSAEDLYGIGRKDYFKRRALRIKQMFQKTADDNEYGVYTGVQEQNPYVTYTHPIRGNYEMDAADVSNNLVSSLLQRMESIEEYEVLREKSSMARSVERSMKMAILNPEYVSFSEKYNSLKKYGTGKVLDEVERFRSVQKIIEKHIDGVSLTGTQVFGKNLGTGRSVIMILGKLQKRLSKMAFAFNLISSFKNYFGGKFQMYKKAFDEKGYSLYDLIATRAKSAAFIGATINQRYQNKNLPVQMQLLHALNAIPNKTKDSVSTYGSTTLIQDIVAGNYATVDRKYLSDSVPVHQIYALMHSQKIKVNGLEKPLYDLVELTPEGLLQTVSGVPEEWKISQDESGNIKLGPAITKLMANHDALLNKNMGVSGIVSEPDAYRSLLGKLVFTMQKFFLGMLMDRYQFRFSKVAARKEGLANNLKFERRRNLDTGKLEYGSYISILVLMQEAVERKGSFWKVGSYSKSARVGLYQLLIGIGLQIMLKLLQRSVGFDQDDDEIEDYKFDPEGPEMFARLKASTSLPNLPFISEKRTVVGTGNSFDSENYMKLQVLNLLKGVEDEEKTFNPLNTIKNGSGLALMNSALQDGGLVKELMSAIKLVGAPDDKQVYSKASGPYVWSEKDDLKLTNMTMRTVFGLNGSMIDPATSLKNKYNPLF